MVRVLDLVLVRAVKNIVKIKLSDHHNSCFHDRTGWISKRRLKKNIYITDRQEIILQKQ